MCSHAEPEATGMSRVVIGGRAVSLCRSHAATVALKMPKTFDDLRQLFVSESERGPLGERRSPLSRRIPDDRRAFPPRPEGRRAASGRRATDV